MVKENLIKIAVLFFSVFLVGGAVAQPDSPEEYIRVLEKA